MKSRTTAPGLGLTSGAFVDAHHPSRIERRTRTRFRLLFPIIFHWSEGKKYSGVGYCKNIALGGIFIVSCYCPPLNSVVIENRWFDFYHNVDTSSQLHEQENRVWREDKVNFHYLPIRPKCVRRVLRHLPVDIRSEHTFIDYGSGKGRALLVAAGLGFRRLLGIELRKELHDRASKNFRECRNLAPCIMESINMDAAEYELPNEKLVLFFFNPFGSEVMATVVRKLGASLNRSFRDVWVVLHDPTPPDLFDETRELRLEAAKDGYRIYRSVS